jgi:hypothetical protein
MVGLLTVLCAPWVRGVPSPRRAVVALAVLQLVVHEVAMWLAGAGAAPTTPAGPSAGHHAPAGAHVGHAEAAGAMAHGGDVALAGSLDLLAALPMLAAHLAAALVLGWAVARGEQSWAFAVRCRSALAAVARAAGASAPVVVLRRLASCPGPAAPTRANPRAVFHWAAPRLAESLWSPRGATRRGPPLLLTP